MAINAPVRLNTEINSRDYSNPERNDAAKALYGAIQSGASNDDLKKFLLGQTGKKQDLQAIQNMNDGDGPVGQTAHVGDVTVNDSAEAKAIAAAQLLAHKDSKENEKRVASQAALLKKAFGGPSNDVEGALSQVESGLSGLNLGTKEGDKTAVAAATRLADGKGQRMTQAQLSAMTPKNAQGDLTAMGNYWAAKANSGFSDADRAAFKALFSAHKDRLGAEVSDMAGQVKEQAPFLAPDLAKSGQLEAYTGTFGSKAKSMLDRLDKMSQSPVKQAPQTPTQGIVPQAADGAFSKIKSLLFGGGGSQPQGAGAPQAAPPQGIGKLLSPQGTTQGQAPTPKPRQVTQNGQTYTLNPTTGEYE